MNQIAVYGSGIESRPMRRKNRYIALPRITLGLLNGLPIARIRVESILQHSSRVKLIHPQILVVNVQCNDWTAKRGGKRGNPREVSRSLMKVHKGSVRCRKTRRAAVGGDSLEVCFDFVLRLQYCCEINKVSHVLRVMCLVGRTIKSATNNMSNNTPRAHKTIKKVS